MFKIASILNVQNLTQNGFPINLLQMNLMTKSTPLRQNLPFRTIKLAFLNQLLPQFPCPLFPIFLLLISSCLSHLFFTSLKHWYFYKSQELYEISLDDLIYFHVFNYHLHTDYFNIYIPWLGLSSKFQTYIASCLPGIPTRDPKTAINSACLKLNSLFSFPDLIFIQVA